MESTTASSSYEEEYLEPTSNGEKILVNNLLLKMIVHHHREVRVRQTFVRHAEEEDTVNYIIRDNYQKIADNHKRAYYLTTSRDGTHS